MAVLGLYQCPACPTDCATAQPPVFTINECIDAIKLHESEIALILFTGISAANCALPAAKPEDWTDAAAWAAVIANTGDDKIRKLNVIGDMPAPEAQIFTLSGGRQKTGPKTFTLNATVDEYNAANYEAMRKLECGYTGFFWFQTKGGFIYGGPNGIKFSVTAANAPKERGENIFERIELQLQWKAQCSPPMIVSPLITECIPEQVGDGDGEGDGEG